MSELYGTSETSDAALAPDTPSAADARSHQYEEPAQADDLTRYEGTLEGDDYTSYDDGGTLTAEEDGLPTRQEAWEQTWGDNPEFYDESDLATLYDGDASTLAAEEEGLPTRQEAREQTWGDDPEHYDENELPAGYEGDTSTLAAEEAGLPTRQEAWEQTWGDAAGDQATDAKPVPGASTSEYGLPNENPQPGDQASEAVTERADAGSVEAGSGEQVLVHDQHGHEVPITVMHAGPEARTVGDDSPAGVGRKPTGEELLHIEGGEKSGNRLDRVFDEAFKEGDDVYDMAGHVVEPLAEDVRSAPPSGDHVPAHHALTGAVVDNQPPAQGLAVNDVAGSIALMGVATVVGIRHGMSRIRKAR